MTYTQTASGLWLTDGLVNVAANLGTQRDKAAHNTYTFTPFSPAQLAAMYRSAWLPRAIVDVPVDRHRARRPRRPVTVGGPRGFARLLGQNRRCPDRRV